jgi:hypothetical protein
VPSIPVSVVQPMQRVRCPYTFNWLRRMEAYLMRSGAINSFQKSSGRAKNFNIDNCSSMGANSSASMNYNASTIF